MASHSPTLGSDGSQQIDPFIGLAENRPRVWIPASPATQQPTTALSTHTLHGMLEWLRSREKRRDFAPHDFTGWSGQELARRPGRSQCGKPEMGPRIGTRSALPIRSLLSLSSTNTRRASVIAFAGCGRLVIAKTHIGRFEMEMVLKTADAMQKPEAPWRTTRSRKGQLS